MGECEIPVNIAMRKNEIEHFITKLERVEEEGRECVLQSEHDIGGTHRLQ